MSSNLTATQEKLIDDLTKEFTKINQKSTITNSKRFCFETIAECKTEEQRFLATMTKHNVTMIKTFLHQFNNEIKAFKKEFGKVLDIQYGYFTRFGSLKNTFDEWVQANKKMPLRNNQCDELYLFIVSKTKQYKGSSDYNWCSGKEYYRIIVDFKRESVYHKLDSGKSVEAKKISGLVYSTAVYIHRNETEQSRQISTSTLDEMVQTNKELQKQIVEMSSE